MAFKSIKAYDEERFGGFFLLRNDGESADVVFLYQSIDDVLVADTHYIKSPEYTGYVHCNGRGCPVCGKKIRVQPKLFIPLYNMTAHEVQFWDRSTRFENQLMEQVFSKYPNPSDYIFTITRKGAAGDINTTYSIVARYKNTVMPYSSVLAENNIRFPDHYDTVCKEYDNGKLYSMLNTSSDAAPTSDLPDYTVTPRAVAPASAPPILSDLEVDDDIDDDELGNEPNF